MSLAAVVYPNRSCCIPKLCSPQTFLPPTVCPIAQSCRLSLHQIDVPQWLSNCTTTARQRCIAQAMGVLSRVLLFNFLNIPFVRRHFHNFLSDKEWQAWLNRRIPFGQINTSEGLSMYPTLTGDREFTFDSLLSYSQNVSLRVGDVVVLLEPNMTAKAWAPKQPKYKSLKCLGKRIAGFEGYCGYMKTGWKGVPASKVIVPRGHCWVLGDNRSQSRDSRRFGPVPLASVFGKTIWRLGPEEFNFIEHDLNYGVTTTSQTPISTIGGPIRPDTVPQAPGPTANLKIKTLPSAVTGPKARLRYSVSRIDRQRSVDRDRS